MDTMKRKMKATSVKRTVTATTVNTEEVEKSLTCYPFSFIAGLLHC